MGKYDLFLRCEGAEDLFLMDLTNEEDGAEIIEAVRDAIMALLASRGCRSTIVHQSGGVSVEIKKVKVAE